MTTLDNAGVPPAEERLRVGTLRYTMGGLVWVFIWLLWGDFCFTMMEAVSPVIVQFRLKDLGLSDGLIPIVVSAIPQGINFVLNPIISTASDRHRGSWGRRVPFMLFSAPFISGALVLLAFYPEIGDSLHHLGALSHWTASAVTLLTLCVLWIMFTVINMFATTVYYYFFNDVVPGAYMARFFGLFRMVANLGGALWGFVFYQHALTHSRAIFLGAATIYLAGFTMMCLGIKEGRYPPPQAMGPGFWAKLRVYAKECCSHRLYNLMFLHNVAWAVSGACGVFSLYFMRDSLGLSIWQIGVLTTGIPPAVQFFLSYPAGILGDKFHPMRVMVWIKIGLVLIVPLDFIWVFGNFRPQTAFYIFMVLTGIQLPLGLLYDTARQPMQMLVWPKSRYGQFCSFNAIVQAAAVFVVSFLTGPFMMGMRWLFPDKTFGKDYCYRMIVVWRLPFLLVALSVLLMMYKEWKKLGGLKHYKVPGFDEAAAEPTGFPVEVQPTTAEPTA